MNVLEGNGPGGTGGVVLGGNEAGRGGADDETDDEDRENVEDDNTPV